MAAINTAVANQMSWPEIEELVDEAKQSGDPTARAIIAIKFDINHITLLLRLDCDFDKLFQSLFFPIVEIHLPMKTTNLLLHQLELMLILR